MGSASLVAAVDRPNLIETLLRLLDRPARSALELARRPLSATLAPATLGIFLVAAGAGPPPGLCRDGVTRGARRRGVPGGVG